MCLFAIKHFVDANINNKAKKSLYVKTSEFEICKIIKSQKNTNSTGFDHFSTKFIKLPISLLAPTLVKLFNHSIQSGLYPDLLKIVKVIPIFKKGDPTSVNNYRPISILSPINKIFEKNDLL